MLQQAGANKLQDPYGASTWNSAQTRLKAMRTDDVKMNDRGGQSVASGQWLVVSGNRSNTSYRSY
jgi:hypothetical protein